MAHPTNRSQSSSPETPVSKQPLKKSSATSSPLTSVVIWTGRLLLIILVTLAPWLIGSVSYAAKFWLSCLAALGQWFAFLYLLRAKKNECYLPCLAIPVLLGLLFLYGQNLVLPDALANVFAKHQSHLYSEYTATVEGEMVDDSLGLVQPSPTRITMDRDGVDEAFQLLVVALMAVLMGALFFQSSQTSFLFPLLISLNGFAISFFGIVQKIKFDGKLFWWIERTQGGIPFGPFINRNNAGGFLLICFGCSLYLIYRAFLKKSSHDKTLYHRPEPLAASWMTRSTQAALRFLADLNGLKLAGFFLSLAIFTGIVATLSRGATVGLVIGIVITGLWMGIAKKGKFIAGLSTFFGISAVGLIVWMGFGSEYTDRMDTLFEANLVEEDDRLAHWGETAPAIWDYLPLGSGVGSYRHVHRSYRSGIEESVFYYAENQYFQTLVEAGPLGLLLLLLAIATILFCVQLLIMVGQSPRSLSVAVLGCFVISSQCIVAIFDFGVMDPRQRDIDGGRMRIRGGASPSAGRASRDPSFLSGGCASLVGFAARLRDCCSGITGRLCLLPAVSSRNLLWSQSRTGNL